VHLKITFFQAAALMEDVSKLTTRFISYHVQSRNSHILYIKPYFPLISILNDLEQVQSLNRPINEVRYISLLVIFC